MPSEEYLERKREYFKEYRARPENAERYRELAKRWRAKNPDRVRDNTLRYQHGISLEDYNAIHDAQQAVCAICGEQPSKGHLAVDHDHQTGKIRGLLCGSCNGGLGLFRDDPERLRRAIDYLDKMG